MNDLKISVIIPIYNVEQFLDECIESVINQTYKNLEIILVDDGSPDNCPQICDKWAKKDARIKVIHKKNEGVSVARNIGLRNATGAYIHFMDADDKIYYDCYETCVREFNNNSDITNVAFFSSSQLSDLGIEKDLVCNNSEIIKLYLNGIARGVSRYLYKKQLIKTLFQESHPYDEDHLFNFFYRLNNISIYKCVVIPRILYFYRTNESSAVHTYRRSYIDDILFAKRKILNNYEGFKFNSEEEQIFFKNLYDVFVYNTYLISKSNLSKKQKIIDVQKLVESDQYKIIDVKLQKKTMKYKIFSCLVKMKWYNILLFLLKRLKRK